MHRAVRGFGRGGGACGCGLMRLFVDDFHLISRKRHQGLLNTSLEGILMEKFKPVPTYAHLAWGGREKGK